MHVVVRSLSICILGTTPHCGHNTLSMEVLQRLQSKLRLVETIQRFRRIKCLSHQFYHVFAIKVIAYQQNPVFTEQVESLYYRKVLSFKWGFQGKLNALYYSCEHYIEEYSWILVHTKRTEIVTLKGNKLRT